jgi:sulfur-carrier protein
MITKFQIPRVLQQYTKGKMEFEIQGQTVADVLNVVREENPQVYISICDETGRLRQHINLFINETLLHERTDFKTKLKDGDVLSVFQSVSGG